MASDDLWPLFSRPGLVPDNPLSPVHMGGGMCWAAVSSLNSTVSEGWRSVVCTSSPSQALCVPMEPPEGHCVHQESVCVRKHCTNGHCNLFPLVHNTSIPLTCTPSLPQMHLSWKTRYIVFLPRPRVWGGLWEWPDLYPTTLKRKSAVWLVPVSAVCSFLSKSSFFFSPPRLSLCFVLALSCWWRKKMEGEGRPEIRHNHPVVAAHENSQVVISGQKTSWSNRFTIKSSTAGKSMGQSDLAFLAVFICKLL